jgi:hypothetical protein
MLQNSDTLFWRDPNDGALSVILRLLLAAMSVKSCLALPFGSVRTRFVSIPIIFPHTSTL